MNCDEKLLLEYYEDKYMYLHAQEGGRDIGTGVLDVSAEKSVFWFELYHRPSSESKECFRVN